jgi:hypothetical protein
MSLFSSSCLIQNWKTGGRNRSCLGAGVVTREGGGGGEMVREGEYGANTVYMYI